MAKIQIKGTVKRVTSVTTKSGKNGKDNRFQSVIITQPGFIDSFGEKKGQDEDWEVQLINESIEKHNVLALNLQGKKVIADVYINSRSYMSSTTNEEQFAINANLAKIEVYNG